MTTKSCYIVWALALMVPGGAILWATDPTTPASTGRVLVLDTDRILEGDIERVGDQYRIRRSIGETWLPASKARRLCASLEDAYAYLQSQANLRDPDERLRLARWCLLHGLRPQALAEAQAAVELRPNHAESERLYHALQRSQAAAVPACPASPQQSAQNDTPPVPVTFDSASLSLFVSRVQPILMNTCANCHASGKGGSFKLARAFDEEGLTNRRATQQNLTAVLSQLHRDRPQESPLLTRAISIHGDSEQPPLKGRQAPAFRTLEEWVQMALATQAAPETAAAPPAPVHEIMAPPATSPKPGPTAELPVEEPNPFADALPRPKPAAQAPVATEPALAPVRAAAPLAPPPVPATSRELADPFDPGIFNQQMHPQQK